MTIKSPEFIKAINENFVLLHNNPRLREYIKMRKQTEQERARIKYNQELRQAQEIGKVLLRRFVKCLLFAKVQKIQEEIA